MSLEKLLSSSPGHYGVFAKNLGTGKTVTYRENVIFPSASVIKVPIMIEVFRRVEEHQQSLDHLLVMRKEDQVGGSGVLKDLTPGTLYSLRDLTTLMITVSDNTATNLLIDFLGVESVNTTLRRLGCFQTELVRRLQRVPPDRATVNHTTAYDTAHLMELLATGQAVSMQASDHMVDLMIRCQGPVSIYGPTKSGEFIGQPTPVTIAHKTGSLSDARHDAGIVYTSTLSYVAAVLSQGAPELQLAKTIARVGSLLPKLLR